MKDIPIINTLNIELRREFGRKMVKLSLDGGFTCPNRDGSKGYGGCIFCSERGSGDNASTIDEQITLLSAKWKDAGYIAYFQNFTNTYAPVSRLREIYAGALKDPRIEGIAIATRPDCIDDEVLELLEEISKERFMWIELGLQTIHQKTSSMINSLFTLEEYNNAVDKLISRKIKVVTHVILGLPGESTDDMHKTVEFACKKDIWGLKLHLLNVIKGTKLAAMYPDFEPFKSRDEYVSLVCDLLEEIPSHIVMHRLSGDSPAELLISPKWSYRKRLILNDINAEMKKRGSFQGCRA